MNKVNSLIICRDKFDSKEEFENAIRDAIMVLLNNEYVMTVRYDECGIVAIDFNYDNQEFGDAYPYWLMPEEWESIYFDRQASEDEE